MGDIAAMIVEELAKRARAAQAQQRRPGTQADLVVRRPVQSPPPPAPAAAPLSPGAVARAQAAAMSEAGIQGVAGGVPAVEQIAAARPELLRAFSGGSALLAGIVLAEALAPPIALREPGSSRHS